MNNDATQQARFDTVVVGLGKTGLACARHLYAAGQGFAIVDSRNTPPELPALKQEMPAVPLYLGGFDEDVLLQARTLLLSPGVAMAQPVIQRAIDSGVEVIGDVELFARSVQAPVVAITGSNGKTTVTSLLGDMAGRAGVEVRVGGNIGTPVLDLLKTEGVAAAGSKVAELYVLEVSSFQLETTTSLNAKAAVVLNISPDHMDRYAGIDDYQSAKQRVYRGCQTMVVNADDARVMSMRQPDTDVVLFSVDGNAASGWDLGHDAEGETVLLRRQQPVLPVSALQLRGLHNYANVLAALALGEAIGLPLPAMLQAAREFAGLPHRCQWLGQYRGIDWINDSKGTNVGATVAALQGFGGQSPIILIAGGEAKDADFSALAEAVRRYVRAVVLIGIDAHRIEAALTGVVPTERAVDMAAAVNQAAALAEAGDTVLMSPACASFDQFANYQARGEAFMQAVQAL